MKCRWFSADAQGLYAVFGKGEICAGQGWRLRFTTVASMLSFPSSSYRVFLHPPLSTRSRSPSKMGFLQPSRLQLALVLLVNAALVSSTCYYPNGGVEANPAFVPCGTGPVSMCCGTNWTANSGGISNDKCEANGLCVNSWNHQPLYWRSSCSDPTWKSPFCLQNLCTNSDVRIAQSTSCWTVC